MLDVNDFFYMSDNIQGKKRTLFVIL